MALTLAEMRSDVDKLVTKLSVKASKEAGGASETVALLGGDGGADAPTTHASVMLMKVTGKMTIGSKRKKKKEPPIEIVKKGLARSGTMVLDALGPLRQTSDLHTHEYPCYVIALSRLQKMDQLEPHDDLLAKGMLEELTRTSRTPSGAFTFFVSQNWESLDTPDNSQGTKLQWLKLLRKHLAIPDTIEVWIWWDFISIPQKKRSLQLKAIASLPYYCSLCTRFIPLVRNAAIWSFLYPLDKNPTLPVGTLESYLERGWCRLELVCALCPKRLGSSKTWKPGPLNMRFRCHHEPSDAGVGRLLTAADLLDPREGKFHRPDDVLAIQTVLERVALEYQSYEDSGSQLWDTLIDVSARPEWLKELAEQTLARGARSFVRKQSTSKALGMGSKESERDDRPTRTDSASSADSDYLRDPSPLPRPRGATEAGSDLTA
eukprot:scaffold39258_cov67-Phaeocystis_antarctica.AAC.6